MNARPDAHPRLRWPDGRAAPTIRLVLFLGFGLIGAIWMVAAYSFASRFDELARRSAEINGRFLRAQELLTRARGQMLGSLWSDLPGSPADPMARRRDMERHYRRADATLQQYVPIVDAASERARIAGLRRQIDELRQALAAGREEAGADASATGASLPEGIVPKRAGVLRVADEVQALNRGMFIRQQADIASLYQVTQRRLWRVFGAAAAASLGIALLAILYAGGLEDRLRRQRVKEADNARDLQRLSSQLLTAQEEERRNIARELHDEVGQVLTAIKVELSVAERAIAAAGGPAHLLQDARSIADGALHTVRDLSHMLRPPLLDDMGLSAAVAWYTKGFGRRHSIPVALHAEGMADRLPPEIEAAAYRIVQEGLTNVARHARARRCAVRLERRGDTLLLSVEDDGIGFALPAPGRASPNEGLGLIGIRERVALRKGSLRIDTAPGAGTRLMVELPGCAVVTAPGTAPAVRPAAAPEAVHG